MSWGYRQGILDAVIVVFIGAWLIAIGVVIWLEKG